MRIGIVSTYPPIECGIATYTEYLVEALRTLDNEVYIVSQFGADGNKVYPAFYADDRDLADKIFHWFFRWHPGYSPRLKRGRAHTGGKEKDRVE